VDSKNKQGREHVYEMFGLAVYDDGGPRPEFPTPGSDIYRIDSDDEKLLAGKLPGYVRGWNTVKRDGNGGGK
jgi:hypothetical protein